LKELLDESERIPVGSKNPKWWQSYKRQRKESVYAKRNT
jgi:hypothetical protein